MPVTGGTKERSVSHAWVFSPAASKTCLTHRRRRQAQVRSTLRVPPYHCLLADTNPPLPPSTLRSQRWPTSLPSLRSAAPCLRCPHPWSSSTTRRSRCLLRTAPGRCVRGPTEYAETRREVMRQDATTGATTDATRRTTGWASIVPVSATVSAGL